MLQVPNTKIIQKNYQLQQNLKQRINEIAATKQEVPFCFEVNSSCRGKTHTQKWTTFNLHPILIIKTHGNLFSIQNSKLA